MPNVNFKIFLNYFTSLIHMRAVYILFMKN